MSTEVKIKEAAGRLRAVMAWAETNLKEHDEVTGGEQEVIARYQPIFAPDAVATLTEEELRSFLLFKNNHHWPLHRQGARICADMDRLREALGILVDESRPIEERLGKLLPKAGQSMVPYLGRAVITAILMVVAPDRWGVWNNPSVASLKSLGVFPDLVSSAPFAERYLAFNRVLNELAAEVGVDLWTLDFLHYALQRYEEVKPPSPEGDEEDELIETDGSPVSVREAQATGHTRSVARTSNTDALADELRLLREQNAELMTVIGQLVVRIADLENTVQKALPPARHETKRRWWQRLLRRRRLQS